MRKGGVSRLESSAVHAAKTSHNLILTSLSKDARDHLMRDMQFVPRLPSPLGQAVALPLKCYFLESGLICHLAHADEYAVETGVVGCEGMLGLPALIGITHSPHAMMVQSPVSAWSIPAETLAEAMSARAIRDAVHRFAHCLRVQMEQTAACNARHHVRERLLRWLLLASDRVGPSSITITQEALAFKLGARRQLVSAALSDLADAKAITYGRSWIKISRQQAALACTCSCYRIIAQEYADILHLAGTP
jgi:CRP-like cAMP-binding protein